MATDLIIAAHGSSRIGIGTAATLSHVEELRRRGPFHSVHAGFLFGRPAIEEAMAAARAPRICVVPFFMSDGAYAQRVVPERLDRARMGAGVDVRYGRPVGTHPGLAEIVTRRAAHLCRAEAVDPADAILVVVGHGSPRDPASAQATTVCAERVRAFAAFRRVAVALLDEAPALADVLRQATESPLVVAGFFADDGRHAGTDLRAALGLEPGCRTVRRGDGRLVAYTGAIGADPAIADIILELAAEVTDEQGALRRSA